MSFKSEYRVPRINLNPVFPDADFVRKAWESSSHSLAKLKNVVTAYIKPGIDALASIDSPSEFGIFAAINRAALSIDVYPVSYNYNENSLVTVAEHFIREETESDISFLRSSLSSVSESSFRLAQGGDLSKLTFHAELDNITKTLVQLKKRLGKSQSLDKGVWKDAQVILQKIISLARKVKVALRFFLRRTHSTPQYLLSFYGLDTHTMLCPRS
ncbi:MAG: hypothetical protein AAF927_02385 [Bacteroidota bacterium]